MLTERIIGYWQEGTGGQFNKDREDAFSITRVMNSIEDTIAEIEEREGQRLNHIPFWEHLLTER